MMAILAEINLPKERFLSVSETKKTFFFFFLKSFALSGELEIDSGEAVVAVIFSLNFPLEKKSV